MTELRAPMLVDSHVNLHSEKYTDDLPEIMERASAAGVGAMLTISDKISSTDAIREIAARYRNVWRSVGAHPHHAAEHDNLDAATLVALAQEEGVVGIGECGLDFHYNYSPKGDQERVFRAHIEAAQETALPLIIHTREADAEMTGMLQKAMKDRSFTPLLHCYTGGPALAETVLNMGGYVSFSGIITFKNAEAVRSVARQTPIDRIIIETDCPYLAPVPMRGRRNEPAYLVHCAEGLAATLNLDADTIAQRTTENFFRLFSKARIDEPLPEQPVK